MKYDPKTAFGNTELIKAIKPKKVKCEECKGKGETEHNCMDSNCNDYCRQIGDMEMCECCQGKGYLIVIPSLR